MRPLDALIANRGHRQNLALQLREILKGKQINVVRCMPERCSTCVTHCKAGPMRIVAALVRRHLDGTVAWAQTRQTTN